MTPAEFLAFAGPLFVTYGPKLVAAIRAMVVIWRDGKEVAISAIEPAPFMPDATMDSVINSHLLADGSEAALDLLDKRDEEDA